MDWYLIIMVLLLFPMTFAYIGYRTGSNMGRLVVFPALCILLFFMAMRAPTIGADTRGYCAVFKTITHTPLHRLFASHLRGNAYITVEHGYRLYNKIISLFNDSGQAITMMNSLLCIVMLGVLIKKRSPYPFLSIWLYLTLGIFQWQMNMARNAIVIFWCYIGFQYIERKRPVKYMACILAGATFHVSSVLFLPLYWIANRLKLTPKSMRNIIISAIFIGQGAVPLIMVAAPFVSRFRGYLHETTRFEGLVVGVFHLLLVAFVMFLTEKPRRQDMISELSIGSWAFILETAAFSVSYYLSLTRVAALFFPYLILYIPNLIDRGFQSRRKKFYVATAVGVICGLQYILRLRINNIGGTMPYRFF